ncbi:ROK family protein [uncultured Paludibaculum sp.]|uniref:ROK family protein n=1 Tax=uncultured Paludibaculum sp. TaxID=1765020 RepID=UPI002AAAF6DD|nr:ROK family protein [uncultured Paludibaculum sp.]
MERLKGKPDRDLCLLQSVVREFGPLSRGRIQEITQIRRSAIPGLVRLLQDQGRLLEAGRVSVRTGRKQVLLRINEASGHVAAVEFDEETVSAGVTDLKPRLLCRITEPTNLQEGSDGLLRQLISCTHRALQESGVDPASLIGVGVADPGLVDSRHGITITSSTIDFWKQVPLKQKFEREFHVPVAVEAKTRAKAVAERVLGSGGNSANMIYVDYGAGIGAGVILDGKLRYGQNCALGEFGHTRTMDGGPACKCGSFGCLEAVAGARAVEARYRQALGEAGLPAVIGPANGAGSLVWSVLEQAARGDKICVNIVAEVGDHLGLGLANLVNLFNPSMVILDTRLGLAGQGLLHQVTQVVKRQALTYTSEHASLRFGSLGDEAGVLGVALIVIDHHFEVPLLKPPKLPQLAKDTAAQGGRG